MSQFDDQTDFEILDLLYEELDEAEAQALKKKLEQDPLATSRMHGWAAVRALSRHVVQDEPELSDHYAILRAARNRVAVEAPRSWWQRLSHWAQVPAIAGLVLVVLSGGLLYSLTGQISDEVTSTINEEKQPIKESASRPEGNEAPCSN